jgi:hypothetical protein
MSSYDIPSPPGPEYGVTLGWDPERQRYFLHVIRAERVVVDEMRYETASLKQAVEMVEKDYARVDAATLMKLVEDGNQK